MSAIPPYPLEVGEASFSFQFISEGPKGSIKKLVLFELISQDDDSYVYNLAFGDKDEQSGELDDLIISDNADTEKVLATVAGTVILFLHLQNRPDIWVYATGSTPSRTRLYRMGISKYYNSNNAEIEIYGETAEGWEPFRRGVSYSAFLCRKLYI